MIMKILNTINAALILSLVSAAHAAQSVDRKIGANGDWQAVEVSGHAYTGKSACLAFVTAKDKSVLELYAERVPETEPGARAAFGAPTVHLIPRTEKPFVRGLLVDDKKRVQIHLMLAATVATPPALGLVSRIEERAKLVEVLKKANTVTVSLINAQNKVVGSEVYSLRGSSKMINAAISACDLSLD
jgi:hypothetical protein